MKAGILNSRIEILHRAKAADGSGAVVYQWQPLMKLWANVRHVSGAESIKGDVLQNKVRASVRIRFTEKVRPEMRVALQGGAVYEIAAVLPDLQRREFVDLVCERVT